MNAEQQSKTKVAAHIRAYLRQRPNAADSLRGIVQWWCADLRPAPLPALVEAALLQLEDAGAIVRVVMADKTILWRAGPRL